MGAMALLLAGAGAVLAATASPPAVADGGRGGHHTTDPVTAIPSGGSGAYTYSWAIVASTYATVVDSPLAATTTFSITGVAMDDTATATAVCTITDSVTLATAQVSVPIEYSRYAGAPGP